VALSLIRAFTPVFDGLWGEGANAGRAARGARQTNLQGLNGLPDFGAVRAEIDLPSCRCR
jgi:hypothetical protein